MEVEYRGVRVNLDHMHPPAAALMIKNAETWIASGMRPPLLTVHADGVDVSEQPNWWPANVTDYCGPGRLEWVEIKD